MPKGIEHGRNELKKPKATLKEKRLRKKEKRQQRQTEHSVDSLDHPL